MRTLQRHRRSLTWIASIASAAAVATLGATAVLAEDPACVVDGTPITTQQLAQDPTLCPDPAPAPADPAPADPAPADPAPAEPTPVDPAPPTSGDPTATPPAPTTDADPSSPDPVDPTATTPAPPADPTSTDPQPPTTSEPTGTEPTGTEPTGTDPTTARPPRGSRPDRPAPTAPTADPEVTRTHRLLRAKQDQAAPFQDARLFREQFTPAGRIPAQPQLDQANADVLVDGARGTRTAWSTLAAVAWLESRWNDPVAGGIVGRRLTADAWRRYGTDGDGDGVVRRSSAADQARTVAVFLARSAPSEHAALRAYFNYAHREVMADRAELLADYFDALGPYALVHGIDDPGTRARLQDRTLADEHIEIYESGRDDIRSGLIDPRVLVTMRYLANRYHSVTISSLVSGHGVFTTSGNVSLHAYGQAMDVAALDGESILGHQQRGGRTWHAVRDILLLPEAMQPAELISLWEMGGPSFAMADHHDHIHVGFKTEPGA